MGQPYRYPSFDEPPGTPLFGYFPSHRGRLYSAASFHQRPPKCLPGSLPTFCDQRVYHYEKQRTECGLYALRVHDDAHGYDRAHRYCGRDHGYGHDRLVLKNAGQYLAWH